MLRAQTSSGSTSPFPTNTMLLTNVQYGSTTEMRLISASSKCRPYGSVQIGDRLAGEKEFIPIAGLARFENIDEDGAAAPGVWATAANGRHIRVIGAANRSSPVTALRGNGNSRA